MKKYIIILLSACLLLMCACGQEPKAPEESSVSIWYINGDVLETALKERCVAIEEDNNIRIELIPFESMQTMSESLQGRRPDLLLCSHELAFSLAEQGMLKSLDVPGLDYSREMRDKYSGLEGGFFPVGASVELLCSNEPLPEDYRLSLEALCTGFVNDGRLLTADSFARVLCSALMQRDGELGMSHGENAALAEYAAIHNLLAETAYSGSLAVFDEGGIGLLSRGITDAAIVSSSALADLGNSLYIYSVPIAEGGRRCTMADMRGFAYLGNTRDNSRAASLVLKALLSDGAGAELALSAGLVSAQHWENTEQQEALYSVLYEIYSQWELVLPSPISPWVMTRQQLEEELSAALGYLQ